MKKLIPIVLLAIFSSVSAQVNLDSSLTACYALNANGSCLLESNENETTGIYLNIKILKIVKNKHTI